MTFDCVPELPRLERERISAPGVDASVLGGWVLTFEGNTWTFDSWAVAVDFVAAGWHMTTPRRSA
jgi:hypothetical protein